jgi:uncharacterized protein YjbJ (UPF0337 family)
MKQEAQGKLTNLKGRVKEAAGVLSGNKELESEGSRERASGALQESLGTARRKVGRLIADVAKKVNG